MNDSIEFTGRMTSKELKTSKSGNQYINFVIDTGKRNDQDRQIMYSLTAFEQLDQQALVHEPVGTTFKVRARLDVENRPYVDGKGFTRYGVKYNVRSVEKVGGEVDAF